MTEIIEIVFGERWTRPVRVRTARGTREIRGPQEAYGYLRRRWPKVPSQLHLTARRQCARALGGMVSPDAVRRAFVVLGRRAGTLA